MSGTLYVVATPIGNLEDITLRALRVLREVSLIAAEDTRRTAKLLHHHAIDTPTTSFHEHNTKRRMPELLGRLRGEQSIALVSDAGTPLVSDPGLELIQVCIEEGIAVDPLPGASAPLAALVGSGFLPQPVTLLGFAPSRSSDRKRWLSELAAIPHTTIFFDTPHRIQATLSEAGLVLGNRPLVLGRELTKVHQEFMRGTADELAVRLNKPRGEFTIVVGPRQDEPAETTSGLSFRDIGAEFYHLTTIQGLSRREAISTLSRRHQVPSRQVYAIVEAAKGRLS
jgi:16S rRNA (cytidine1402-2'-O)-methyltransferase